MEFDGKNWISMTWERTSVHYMSNEPVQPYFVQSTFQEKISCNILDCAYDSDAKTGRVFLISEDDEDDEEEDEGPWSHEYIYKSKTPVMNTPYNGSLSTVRLRFSGR
ncbi:MAG TPA: hypothetical protein VL485_13810 [Ktedonobacteraceae bacterium]|jgi:hypothetical protein|nr:hypothetical protein [Ktedonobacteraceae bacterium]